MTPKLIMFCVFIFFIGTILSLLIEGTWMGSAEVTVMNQLTGFTTLEVSGAGIWAIPKQIIGFFIHGLPKLIMWDYSFLSGTASIFKWVVLYPISAGVVYGIALVFISVVQGIFGTLRP